MFVTRKTLNKEIANMQHSLDWWRDHYSELKNELREQKEAHERLLKYMNLYDNKVLEHYKLEVHIK
jgi:hypothetical protein